MQTVNASPAQTINEQKNNFPNLGNQNTFSEISEKVINLPVMEWNGELTVSAILLHGLLQVSTKYSMWFQRRIKEYRYENGSDYFPNLGSKKQGRGNFSVDYILTLDMAKELAMLENNEIGSKVRRGYINLEKKVRDWIGFILPRLQMDYNLFDQREGYIYLELLKACKLSLKSGSRSARVRKNKQEFWRNGKGDLCVSETYGKAIITNAIARRLNMETKERRLEYQANQLPNQTEGGSHE